MSWARSSAARVAVFAAICAWFFVGALPQGVCFCDLEGGSCCGPAPDLCAGEEEASARAAAASPAAEAPCCDACAREALLRARPDRTVGAAGSPPPVVAP